ncbi:hypothetical protein J4436_04605 [Candidatus Woesearchaeota archaeon]|nr:hypothetical protein [Candidatus Woesearchaeota archaeon]
MIEITEETKVIVFTNKEVAIHNLYKGIKTELELNGYIFGEAKQKIKSPGKYGQEMEFEIKGFRAFDDFAKHELTISLKFEKLKAINSLFKGNGLILTDSRVILDYTKKWDKTKFTQWLFGNVMFPVLRYRFYKAKYLDPGLNMQLHMNTFIKEHLDLY